MLSTVAKTGGVFLGAVEMPEEQRVTFVREQCGADDQLRAEIEALLAADVSDSPIIAYIIDDATTDLLHEDLRSD